jgi:hypothetical protein
VTPSFPMHKMNMLEFLLNNPEWVTLFATIVFATVSTYIIWCQKNIMKQQVLLMQQQGEKSLQHERMQNILLTLQHEHDWLASMNVQREAILKTAKRLHINTLFSSNVQREAILKTAKRLHINTLFSSSEPTVLDAQAWREVQTLRSELKLQLEVLDFAAYSPLKNGWYMQLMAWVDALLPILSEDLKARASSLSGDPTEFAREAVSNLEKTLNPVAAIHALQRVIKDSSEEFNTKWFNETREVTR